MIDIFSHDDCFITHSELLARITIIVEVLLHKGLITEDELEKMFTGEKIDEYGKQIIEVRRETIRKLYEEKYGEHHE